MSLNIVVRRTRAATMIVDTSAILAIHFLEEDHAELYALVRVTGEPLLFTGKDFKNTDITSALEGGHERQ